MTTRPQQPADRPYTGRSPPKACLIALAGTPDDASWIDRQLMTIAQLSADLIAPTAYASITAYRDDAVTTVAASSEIAVDQAQYDDEAGPCLDAVDTASPVSVPDVAAAMRWPGFRKTADQLGVTASLSMPLFAGSGSAIAALNLYGRVPDSLAALTAAVWLAYDPSGEPGPDRSGTDCDEGGEELVAGLIGVFAVRAGIQQAIGVIMANTHRTAKSAYLILRLRAAETGDNRKASSMSKPRLSAYSRIAMLELDPHRIGRNPLQNLVQAEQSFSHVTLPRLGARNRAAPGVTTYTQRCGWSPGRIGSQHRLLATMAAGRL